MRNRRHLRIGGCAIGLAIGLAWLAAALAGCSVPLSDLPQQMGGLPAGAPPRPETEAAFPAVHDMPPQRQESLLDPEEQKKVQRELERAREQQSSKARAAAEQK